MVEAVERTAVPLVLIAAVARNGVIGRDGALPWRLPADMAHFRTLTQGCPVIMGRRTWDSLPARFRPLPGRTNIVVTRDPRWQADGANVVASLDAALTLGRRAARQGQRIFVIGGAQLYRQALPLADQLELTELHADADGDVHFPPLDRRRFREVRRDPHAAGAGQPIGFDFVTYHRQP